MAWEYRVIEGVTPQRCTLYQIRLVETDERGRIINLGEDAPKAVGRDLKELQEQLIQMMGAFHKPVIDREIYALQRQIAENFG